MNRTDTVVIGAGQAGLAMSHELSAAGRDHVIVERGELAERWRSTWDSLHLLTPNWMSRLPGWSYAGPDPDGYMSVAQLRTYLARYARSFDAPVRDHTVVGSVRADGSGYVVTTDGGTWSASHVVVATGSCDLPARPTSSLALDASVQQLDAGGYRNPDILPAGGVLVVGASASGAQIADELASAGRDVVLAAGAHTRLPRTYRGQDILWWLDRIGSLDRTIDQLPDPDRARREPSYQLIGRSDQRSLDLNTLAANGVTVAGRLVGAAGTRVGFATDLDQTTAVAETRMRRVLTRVDEHVRRTGAAAGEPDVPAPVQLLPAPCDLDLRARGITSVIWASGHRRAYPWLHVPVLDHAGEIAHHRGITAAPGLFVLGMRFQHRRSSSFLDGVRHDARYLAHHLTGAASVVDAA